MANAKRSQSGVRRGEKTAEDIRSVALDLFYKRGFQATTLRHVAARVGIQVGSLYNHITSKGELLFEIMETVMLDLLEDQRQVAQTADVVERMRLLVYHHVKFHGERAEEVFIGNSELRSLNRQQRQRIVGLRREYELMFQKELEDGIRQGKFLPVDVQITAYGIIAMTTWVSAWYSSRGRLSLEEIAEIYTAMVLRGIWNPAAGKLESHLRLVAVQAKVVARRNRATIELPGQAVVRPGQQLPINKAKVPHEAKFTAR